MEHFNYTQNEKNNQFINKRTFSHLSQKDRILIQKYLVLKNDKNYKGPKITISFIAGKIGVNKSTVSREIKKGTYHDFHYLYGTPRSRYLASFGQGVADKNKARSHYKTKLKPGCDELKELAYYINHNADPLTALAIYQEAHGCKFPVCEKTIYNYFHKKILPIKRGKMTQRKIYVKHEKVQKMTQKGANISERPLVCNDRLEFGHWEGDLIVGAKGKSKECLFTIIDRFSRLYLAFKIPNKKTESVVNLLNNIETTLSTNVFKAIFKTITFDNGNEFSDFKSMETSITGTQRCQIFYANPYSSWERGSNENGNKMMRKYFPKGTDFSMVSNQAILNSTNMINYSIRKKLHNQSSVDKIKETNVEIINHISLLGLKNPYIKLKNNFNNL